MTVWCRCTMPSSPIFGVWVAPSAPTMFDHTGVPVLGESCRCHFTSATQPSGSNTIAAITRLPQPGMRVLESLHDFVLDERITQSRCQVQVPLSGARSRSTGCLPRRVAVTVGVHGDYRTV